MKTALPLVMTLLLHSVILTVAAPARDESPFPAPPPSGRWVSEGTYKEGGLKAALLIGVGKHAVERTAMRGWNLECVADDLAAMEGALRDEAGFHHITTLRDNDATLSRIEGYLTTDLAEHLRGSDNLLLVYYSGHGVVQDSERAWFTYYTDLEGQSRYSKLLTTQHLVTWLRRLQSEADVNVCLVMDSCATSEKAPAGRPREVRLGDERIFATSLGRKAASSAFTDAFVRSLRDLSDREAVRFREIYDLTRSTLEKNRLARPEYASAGGDSAVVIDKANLSLTIRAVDGLTPELALDGARVLLGGKEKGRTPEPIANLPAGKYPFIVEMPGYLRSRVIVDLSPAMAGGVYEVPLLPEYAVIEGKVRSGKGGVPIRTKVEVLGNTASFRTGLHTATVEPGPDGTFRLLVVPGAEISGIRVAGLTDPVVKELDLGAIAPENRALDGNNMIRVHPVGTIVLRGSEAMAESDLKLGGLDSLYRQAQVLASSGRTGDLKRAASVLVGLHGGTTDAATRTELEAQIRDWLSDVFGMYMKEERYAEGCRLASDYCERIPGEESFREWQELFERENIPTALRREIEAAAETVRRGDLRRAESAYAALIGKSAELTSYHVAQVTGNLAAIRAELFQESFCAMMNAMANRDMVEAGKHFVAAEPLAPDIYRWTMKEFRTELLPFMDRAKPVIVWENPPAERKAVEKTSFLLRGRVSDDYGVEEFRINGRAVPVRGEDRKNGRFQLEVELAEGENRFEAVASDRVGNEASATVFVTYRLAPEVVGFTFLRGESFSCGGVTQNVKIYSHDQTGLEFVLVPGGVFEMGCLPKPGGASSRGKTSGGRLRAEKPVRKVVIEPFLICRTECTQDVWVTIMKSTPWRGQKYAVADPSSPATHLNWKECWTFCRITGLRLPSEAEWEYACRAGTTTAFSFGAVDAAAKELGEYAWWDGNTRRIRNRHVQPAGGKLPNAFGLFDMHGNAIEWCEDRWHDNYTGAPINGKPWVTGNSPFRACRGGSWYSAADKCRSDRRLRVNPETKRHYIGFRPVHSLPR